MDDNLRHQRDTSLAGLEALIRRGHQIRIVPAADVTRAWQQDCAAAINQLSGGSKAHWLARAYGDAFLVRSAGGGVVVEVDAMEIVEAAARPTGSPAPTVMPFSCARPVAG